MIYIPHRDKFSPGNESATCSENGKFYKVWPQRAPAHDFLYSNNWQTLTEAKLVPRFFPELSGAVSVNIPGDDYAFLYVFEQIANARHVTPEIVVRDYESAA